MERIAVPDEALKFILFQRTAYLRLPRTFVFRALKRLLPFSIFKPLVVLEAIDAGRIRRLFEEDMNDEYLSIRDFLPATCSSILDIGCGVAGIDVLLSKHYRRQEPVLFLLDKTRTDDSIFYGFEAKGAFYSSLGVAKATLLQNGVPEGRIVLLEANDANDIPIERKIDLIISLISWGFHYPIEVYLDRVRSLLSKSGRLIVDVRKGTDGAERLEKAFGTVQVIAEREKFERIVASH